MSSNLWVGNLAADVSDSDLRNLFEKHGVVDSVTCYPLRSYAFVSLKRAEDAKRARDNLQGVILRGSPLKVDVAKPAKPCKSLWITGISTSISKEDLKQEFSIFGKIEDFKFQLDKNAAYVNFYRLEDASKALKAMNGKIKGGTMIRVDYDRSYSRRQILPLEGRKGDEEQPSNILCISYPPAVHIDEQMLHNAMILFGEIEKIRSFPSRFCSFVEFRSMEEAQRAKEGLQGKLFNDPRISITFSTNEPAPNQFLPGTLGLGPKAVFNNSLPFQAPLLDVIGQPVVPNSFHWHVIPHGVNAHDTSMRPFAPPGGFDSILAGPDFNVCDPNPVNPIGGLNRMLSSPSGSMIPSTKPTHGPWNVFDASQSQREAKRLRTDGAMHMPSKEMNDRGLVTDQISRGVPQVRSGVPSNTRFTSGTPNIDRPDVNYIWRGIIAKGGIPVCRARCVPVGDWIGYEMPEIVNCSARTGLDMLAKHHANAVGFDIIFFLPDTEDDFASYTEFLRYLGDLNRAGVVKFVDGATLFLVPPSDFLTTVLKVSGPDRLYGVVLKFPSCPPISQPQKDYTVVPYSELPGHPTSHPPPVYSVPPVASSIPTSTYQAGLSLTPELVATLTSLAKVNSNGSGPQLTSVASDLTTGQYTQQGGSMFQSQGQTYPSNTVNVDPNYLAVSRNSHIQDPSFNLPHHEAVVSMSNSSSQAPQGVQFSLPMPTQQYQPNYQQDMHAVTSSSQVYGNGTNVYEHQSMVPGGIENSGEQMQQHQSASNGVNQRTLEFDADKNERYQSTLQFAANLLFQIHQKRSGTK